MRGVVEFYGLKSCDTCRKALKALAASGVAVQVLDMRKDGVPAAVLARAVEVLGADKVLNMRSTTWRGLSEVERQTPVLELLAKHPTLIKRPLIVDGTDISVGWSAGILAALEA